MRREPLPGSTVLHESFWDNYDSRTLIYDCIYDPHTRELRLFCPLLLNLKPLLECARFEVGGTVVTPSKFARWSHHECIVFRSVPQAEHLRCLIASLDISIRINIVDRSLQALNVLYTMMKNEDLNWIQDWATYHVRQHGAQAVVLCDNGSDAYAIADVDGALAEVEGLQAVHVVSCPPRKGPLPGDCTDRSGQKYLQAALLNIMRYRFCATAGPMLCIDIDELVVGLKGESIFEATRKSLLGYIGFHGTWRNAVNTNAPVRHTDHTLIDPEDPPLNTKYCVRPTSLVARLYPMQVHNVRFGLRKRLTYDDRFTFLHCRNISTSWKYDRGHKSTDTMYPDPLATKVLAAAFPESTP